MAINQRGLDLGPVHSELRPDRITHHYVRICINPCVIRRVVRFTMSDYMHVPATMRGPRVITCMQSRVIYARRVD